MHGPGDQPAIKPARQAAIDRHVKDLHSGNPKRQQQGALHLQKMALNQYEQRYLHETANNPHVPKNLVPLQHIAPTRGPFGAAKRNPHSEFGNVVEALTGYKQIEHIRQHPIGGTIALMGITPIGRAARLGELGVEAARGVTVAERAVKAAQAAEDANGVRKALLTRKAIRLSRRADPEEAQAILQTQAQNATARATKAAHKNLQFVEHLPGESRPETGGDVGLAVRNAMKGADRIYKKQKDLQQVERLKRTSALARGQEAAKSFEEAAGAQKALAGELPKVPFKNFEPLRPLVDQVKEHLDTLNMLPHDKNRLLNAIKAGIEGHVPAPNQRKLIESVFGREVKQLSPETIKARGLVNNLSDIGNIPRAIESSLDASGMFRQNLAAIAHNPRLAFKDYGQVLKSTFSEDEFKKFMAEKVYGHPYYHMAVEDGVPFTKIDGGLNQHEEAFASNLAEHLHELPGIRNTPLKYPLRAASAGIRASDRNYVALLNGTRIREYQAFVEQAAENGYRLDGPQGEKLRKEIGDTVATLTGRGNLGKYLTAHRATFNALFFSPGLMKSRINLLNPLWYLRAEPFVRQERLRTALRLYGTLSMLLFSAKMAGAKVSTDPTNADFGKIRVGNTRIDPAGGLTQYMRLIGQLYEGKITSSVTGKVEPLSTGPFKTSRGNVVQQFARNKFSPLAGLGYDALFGPGFGQKLSPKSIAGQMFVPLLMQDMWQISHAHGPGGGPGMAAETFFPDLFGIGVQNYSGKKSSGANSTKFGGTGSSSFGGGSGSSFP